MSTQPDFTVERADGTPTLVVEVKGRSATSDEWASQFRRNLLRHDDMPKGTYFLLACTDTFYLWGPKNGGAETSPDFVADARPLLQPYFDSLGPTSESSSGSSLKLFVYGWLSELVNAPGPEHVPSWMKDSGLFDVVKGARLRSATRN